MSAMALLRQARRDSGLTQRELSTRTGVAQPTIARIEAGASDPRAATLERLLLACGHELTARRSGEGVDRTQIRELLRLSPIDRLKLLQEDVAGLRQLERAIKR